MPHWHRFFYGISLFEPTEYIPGRPQYHAVDVYHQPFEFLGIQRYAWYVAKDITDPLWWYSAQVFKLQGIREFEEAQSRM